MTTINFNHFHGDFAIKYQDGYFITNVNGVLVRTKVNTVAELGIKLQTHKDTIDKIKAATDKGLFGRIAKMECKPGVTSL